MNEFGVVLKEWRNRRHQSQLALAQMAGVSARHLSFLESGRSKPSRSMVMRLVEVLDVAPAEANAGLIKAGFAPAFPQCTHDDASVAMVQQAVETTLNNHSPWPAIACDGQWNLLLANPSARMMLNMFGTGESQNLVQMLLEAANSPVVLNWPELARSLLRRLRTEALDMPASAPLHSLISQLGRHPRIGEGQEEQLNSSVDVIVPMRLQTGEAELSLFSMIAQFGSVQEVTYSDTRLELFYPADAATTAFMRSIGSVQKA